MSTNQKILVLTLSFGSGHVRVAQAITDELQRTLPDAEVRLLDALEDCRYPFRLLYVWPYWAMLRFFPELWRIFFSARMASDHEHTAPAWALRWGFAPALRAIASFQPDLLVACEVGACDLSVIAVRSMTTTAKIAAVITDFEAEPIWIKPEIEIYVVPDEHVREQLTEWGAEPDKIEICGIPLDRTFYQEHDAAETRRAFGLDGRPMVLLMGGGMGPTRMDEVAADLLKSDSDLQIIALPGFDRKVIRGLSRLQSGIHTRLTVLKWTDEVAKLMQAADLLVTKPGGVTLAEAATSSLPCVLFDAIPGPETINEQKFVRAGAARRASSTGETAKLVLSALRNDNDLDAMMRNITQLARPKATREIAELLLKVLAACRIRNKAAESSSSDGPVLIFSISNGSGHNRTADGIVADLHRCWPSVNVEIVDVANHMGKLARFTHITAFLWLVKNAPALWKLIDSYQKKQTATSPDWFYRRECRRMFDLVRKVRPKAIVATEVGCCEIAALIKRDLCLDLPLIAIHTDIDADRAWVRPEVDLYCLATDACAQQFCDNGAPKNRIAAWGPVMAEGYAEDRDAVKEKRDISDWLHLDPLLPIILVAGGGEGIGQIEETVRHLSGLQTQDFQTIVLCGHNKRLKARCDLLASRDPNNRIRVLGWTGPETMPRLMYAADLTISKLGNMFHEAIACGLPIIALEPPAGAERLQYRLLDEWKIGRGVRTNAEMIRALEELLKSPELIQEMRSRMQTHKKRDAGEKVAAWLMQRVLQRSHSANMHDDGPISVGPLSERSRPGKREDNYA